MLVASAAKQAIIFVSFRFKRIQTKRNETKTETETKRVAKQVTNFCQEKNKKDIYASEHATTFSQGYFLIYCKGLEVGASKVDTPDYWNVSIKTI